MLTFEIMGVLGLAILWVNTLLVVGAALTPLSELWSRLRRAWQPAEILEGAADGVLAEHVVEQIGRKASDDRDRQAILFHDRAYRSELAGGVIDVAGEKVPLEPGEVEVWIPQADKIERATHPAADFEEAYRASRRAKGFVREVRSALREGQTVWFAPGEKGSAPVLLASFDPRGWLRGRIALVIVFQVAMIALSAVATYLCLYPPLFGTISKLGGLLGLVHFLLIMQPLGVTVREAALLPHVAVLRQSWVKTGSEGKGVTAQLLA